MFERKNKKEYEFDPDLMNETFSMILERANSNSDTRFRVRLFFWAGLSEDVKGEFKINRKTIDGNPAFDFVLDNGANQFPVFHIAKGNSCLLFLNKTAFAGEDKWVYRSVPDEAITNDAKLIRAIYGFILMAPNESEMLDVNRGRIDERMNASGEKPKGDLEGFISRKKQT